MVATDSSRPLSERSSLWSPIDDLWGLDRLSLEKPSSNHRDTEEDATDGGPNATKDDHDSSCAPVALRLEMNHHLGCLCKMDRKRFLDAALSFVRRYGSGVNLRTAGIAVHYDENTVIESHRGVRSMGSAQFGTLDGQSSRSIGILHPENSAFSKRDRMILSDVYERVCEEPCNTAGHEIRLVILQRPEQRPLKAS